MPQPSGLRVGEVIACIEVLAEAGRTKASKRLFTCRCHCGRKFTLTGGNLKSGLTKSCGCLNSRAASERATARNRTHGGTGTPTYRSWAGMLSRCRNPNATGYHRWGGRGIKVSDRWTDFANFLADMGERPAGETLDRWPNPDGNYEPGNCRWATPVQQAANKSKWIASPSASATTERTMNATT